MTPCFRVEASYQGHRAYLYAATLGGAVRATLRLLLPQGGVAVITRPEEKNWSIGMDDRHAEVHRVVNGRHVFTPFVLHQGAQLPR